MSQEYSAVLVIFLLNLSRVLNNEGIKQMYQGALAILLFLVIFTSIAIK